VFFPDPWHKKRHHKRRLIEPAFVSLVAAKLRLGGTLRLATDWQAYAEQMLAVCNANALLRSLSQDLNYVARPEFRPPTRFERRGERLGHGVWDLAYSRREKTAANAVDDELNGERSEDHAG
jgi:tRNA (guanine-N7-)-methyltransferase